MINSIGGLATKTHAKFWVSIFFLFRKWHHAYLGRAYMEAEVSLPIGYFLMFKPHPV